MSQFRGLCLMILFAATLARAADDWQPIAVPGTWEEKLKPQLEKYDGVAWYRCYVKVPDSWVDLKLYFNSLVLQVSKIADVHEAYVNGIKLGGAGSFPPKFESGATAVRRHKIAPTVLKKGVWNVIAIRVYNHSGPGGFTGSIPPVIASYQDEIKLEGQWEFRTGDDAAWASAPVTEKPASAAYSTTIESSSPLEQIAELVHGESLPPAEALKKIAITPELKLDQVLTEPDIAQPIFMNFDERGRMWVVEFRQYPYPAGLKMLARNKYYRFVFDKIPEPPPHGPKGADRISIHEDTDGDGTYDSHKVFLNDLNIATSCARGRGGVWVLQPPYLLFYADANNDDVPDGDPVVHLEGFGLEDTHAATNSLSWGPDGWLYSTQGSNTVAHVKVRGVDRPEVLMDGPGVWRYHPATKRFEVFAEGGGNAFGMEIDSQGRIYSGTNGNNTRGFYYVQGGYYAKGTEAKFMPVSNPYAFDSLPYIPHTPNVPRFTHSFIRYEGAALPKEFNDKIFAVDPLAHRVMLSDISARGSSFATVDMREALNSTDPAFRPVGIAVGPDGAIYVADMYEFFIAHGQHYQGQIDPTTGRIYRLRGNEVKSPRTDLYKKNTVELIELLNHENKWFRQTALRVLVDRNDKGVALHLLSILQKQEGQLVLEALWALYQLQGLDSNAVATGLGHVNPSVRMWTVRLLGDELTMSPENGDRLLSLARSEQHPEVLCQIAATARRVPAGLGLALIEPILKSPTAENDLYLPLMAWWAIEAHCGKPGREHVLKLFENPAVWEQSFVQKHILSKLMRRFAASDLADERAVCAQLLRTAPKDTHVELLMTGFELAFKGRTLSGLPDELLQALKRTKLAASLSFRVRMQDKEALKEACATALDPKTKPAERLDLVEALANSTDASLIPTLVALLDAKQPENIRAAALAALQTHADDTIGTEILNRYATFTPALMETAQTLLATRPAWTLQFLAAAEAGKVERKTVPKEIVRKMMLHGDDKSLAAIGKLWGELKGADSAEKRAQIKKYTATLAAAPGDPYAGRKLYDNSCGKCHQLFQLGGKVGPDLTPFKRDDIATLLINIVEPSAEIREGYETYAVATTDGRMITGFRADEDKLMVAIRTQDGQTVRINKTEIKKMKKQDSSLMPEELLNNYSEQELRDLFAYLRSTQPGR